MRYKCRRDNSKKLATFQVGEVVIIPESRRHGSHHNSPFYKAMETNNWVAVIIEINAGDPYEIALMTTSGVVSAHVEEIEKL
jgi:hypothetical protein